MHYKKKKVNMISGKSAVPAALFALALFLCPSPVFAESGNEPDNLEAVLEGFDDASAAQAPADGLDAVLEGFEAEEGRRTADAADAAKDAVLSWLSIDGYLQFGTSYNFAHESPQNGKTDWRGFSRSRIDLQLDLTARISDSWSAKIGAKGFYDALYSLKGRDEYTQAVLDEYEDELELREVYVQGQLTDNLDLKMGRQIAVWGKSDNIRVTDVLNPLDMREPGLTDIEDLRLPVSMTKLNYYFGDWNLAAMAIHEIRFNKIPVYGHDFYQADTPLPPEDEPENSLENTEWAFSLGGIFSGWDLDFYYARLFNDTPHLVTQNGAASPVRQHERLHMFGIAYNRAMGNWLVKTEAALLDGIEYTNRPGENYSRFDGLIGLEYTGFKETSISLEFADRHIIGYDSVLENPPDGILQDMFQAAFRYNRDFLNDTLSLSLLAMIYGPSAADGAFERLSLEYDLTDTVLLRGGAVLYQSGDLFNMREIGDNDRLFAEIRYSF